MTKVARLLVNFGGPRDLSEVESFLKELLTDQEVIRTPFPAWVHRLLFHRIAKKRAVKVQKDYALIGGKSPIFEDTESLAKSLRAEFSGPVLTFHRYLPHTHTQAMEQLKALYDVDILQVVPLFPQFSYATTGSIALWFKKNLSKELVMKMRWMRSYATHPGYVRVMQQALCDFLVQQQIKEEEVFLLFSAHGLPQEFIQTGDPYQRQCQETYLAIIEAFPNALSMVSYQSQFGKKPWIRPYTSDISQHIEEHVQDRKKVVIIPVSFTSDHIETLFEIERDYLETIRQKGLQAYRCPALNLRSDWVQVLKELFLEAEKSTIECMRCCQKNKGCRGCLRY